MVRASSDKWTIANWTQATSVDAAAFVIVSTIDAVGITEAVVMIIANLVATIAVTIVATTVATIVERLAANIVTIVAAIEIASMSTTAVVMVVDDANGTMATALRLATLIGMKVDARKASLPENGAAAQDITSDLMIVALTPLNAPTLLSVNLMLAVENTIEKSVMARDRWMPSTATFVVK